MTLSASDAAKVAARVGVSAPPSAAAAQSVSAAVADAASSAAASAASAPAVAPSARLRTYALCFVFAGAAGVVAQLLYLLWHNVNAEYAVELAFATMGVIGAALYAAGIFQKMEDAAGFGAVLPLSGYTAGISGFCEQGLRDKGTVAAGILGGCKLTLVVIGGGAVFTTIYGLICGFAGLEAPAPTFRLEGAVQIACAFALTGALCTVAQVFLDVTRMDKIKYLILWGVFGGLLSSGGFIALMGALGGTCGPSVLAFTAGDSFFRAAVQMSQGSFHLICVLLVLFTVLTAIGIAGGFAHRTLAARKEAAQAPAR